MNNHHFMYSIILILQASILHSMQPGEKGNNPNIAACFEKIDLRIGKIVAVRDFSKSPNHQSYAVDVDLGPKIGTKQSVLCAELRASYTAQQLVNRLVVCTVNFPPRKMANDTISEVAILGVPGENEGTILITPDRPVALGSKLY